MHTNRLNAFLESIGMRYGFVAIVLQEMLKMFGIIFIALPILVPCLVPLLIIFFLLTRFFNAATAQYRRLTSAAMSIVCSSLGDAYAGAASIRAYGEQSRFRAEFNLHMNKVVESRIAEAVANFYVQA